MRLSTKVFLQEQLLHYNLDTAFLLSKSDVVYTPSALMNLSSSTTVLSTTYHPHTAFFSRAPRTPCRRATSIIFVVFNKCFPAPILKPLVVTEAYTETRESNNGGYWPELASVS